MSTQILSTKPELKTNLRFARFKENLDIYTHVALSEPDKLISKSHIENGFLDAFITAYMNHLHLRIKPDDIWIVIAQGISTHINLNGEKFRSMFVNHGGQKQISVDCEDCIGDINMNWSKCITLLTEEVSKNVKTDIVDSIRCSFSTTTEILKTVSEIVLLDAMKTYFKYKLYGGCGIPKITLEGTLDDWILLLDKFKKLKTIDGLEDWFENLEPILNEFINTYKGNVNTKFWDEIMIKEGTAGSGSYEYYSGWILKFFPYDKKNSKINYSQKLNANLFPLGKKTIDFDFLWLFCNENIKMNFQSGFYGIERNDDGSINPFVGWIITDVNDDNKFNELYNKYSRYKRSISKKILQ